MTGKEPFDKVHALISNGTFDAALKELHDPERNVIKPPYDCDENHAWYIVGDIYNKQGKHDCAIEAYHRSLQEWSEDSQSYWALGDIHSNLGNHVEAERFFRRALEIEPNSEVLKYNLANALFDQGKFREAVPLYEKTIRGEPKLAGKARKNLKLAKAKIKES